MIARVFRALAVVLGLTVAPLIALAAAPAGSQYEFPPARRILAVGSVLGHFEDFRSLLLTLGVVDAKDNWAAGDATFVQFGNLYGDGASLDDSIKLLMKLEKQAEAAGGKVHVLHAKTEEHTLRGDLSKVNRGPRNTLYVVPATPETDAARQALLNEKLVQFDKEMEGRANIPVLRQNYINWFNDQTLPGGAEYLKTIAPGTEMGDWLRSRPAVIKIGDIVFAYNGVSEPYAELSLDEMNEKALADVKSGRIFLPRLVDTKGPLWWSDLSFYREAELTPRVEWICHKLGARAMVVGQSPVNGTIRRGRVVHVESRIGNESTLSMQGLEVFNGNFYLQDGGRRSDLGTPDALPAEAPAQPPLPGERLDDPDPVRRPAPIPQ